MPVAADAEIARSVASPAGPHHQRADGAAFVTFVLAGAAVARRAERLTVLGAGVDATVDPAPGTGFGRLSSGTTAPAIAASIIARVGEHTVPAALGAGLAWTGLLVAATADRTSIGDGHDALVLTFADYADCHAQSAVAARADALTVLVGVEQRAGPRAQGARR